MKVKVNVPSHRFRAQPYSAPVRLPISFTTLDTQPPSSTPLTTLRLALRPRHTQIRICAGEYRASSGQRFASWPRPQKQYVPSLHLFIACREVSPSSLVDTTPAACADPPLASYLPGPVQQPPAVIWIRIDQTLAHQVSTAAILSNPELGIRALAVAPSRVLQSSCIVECGSPSRYSNIPKISAQSLWLEGPYNCGRISGLRQGLSVSFRRTVVHRIESNVNIPTRERKVALITLIRDKSRLRFAIFCTPAIRLITLQRVTQCIQDFQSVLHNQFTPYICHSWRAKQRNCASAHLRSGKIDCSILIEVRLNSLRLRLVPPMPYAQWVLQNLLSPTHSSPFDGPENPNYPVKDSSARFIPCDSRCITLSIKSFSGLYSNWSC